MLPHEFLQRELYVEVQVAREFVVYRKLPCSDPELHRLPSNMCALVSAQIYITENYPNSPPTCYVRPTTGERKDYDHTLRCP